MSHLVNNVSPSMNVDYAANQQSLAGSKRKTTSVSDNSNSNGNIDLLNNQNSGFITANNINNSARQKISNENNVVSSNNNSNSIHVVSNSYLNDEDLSIYSVEITATSVQSYDKKTVHRFFGKDRSLVSDIYKKVSDLELLDGDGCASIQVRDDDDCVTKEPLHIHFKVERGCVGKFEGKISLQNQTEEAKLALVGNRLVAVGKNAIKTMPNGVVCKGDAEPAYINGKITWLYVNSDGSYQGEMPPKTVVIFNKKIVNKKVLEIVAYLPSGELVVGIQHFGNNIGFGKKENSPADEGKVMGNIHEGRWVKFKQEDGGFRTWDGRFENDELVEGTIYPPEGGSIKVEPPK